MISGRERRRTTSPLPPSCAGSGRASSRGLTVPAGAGEALTFPGAREALTFPAVGGGRLVEAEGFVVVLPREWSIAGALVHAQALAVLPHGARFAVVCGAVAGVEGMKYLLLLAYWRR